MKSVETLLACCVVGLAAFIGGQAFGMRAAAVTPVAEATAAGTIGTRKASRNPLPARTVRPLDSEERVADGGAPARPSRAGTSPEELRRRIALGMEGTYIGELLAARDSAIARWPSRTTRPLRIHVSEGAALEGWTPDFLPAVRDAFDTWVQAGIPLRFTFVTDSVSADIHVSFVDRFANGISGKTVWARDGNYWLLASDIQLAVTHPNGGTVSPPQMRAIALHEVGHLLGLDHTSNADNIMSARVRVRELSEQDRATIRLVYAVPAGSLKR